MMQRTSSVELERALELDELQRVGLGQSLLVRLLGGVEPVDVCLVVLGVVDWRWRVV